MAETTSDSEPEAITNYDLHFINLGARLLTDLQKQGRDPADITIMLIGALVILHHAFGENRIEGVTEMVREVVTIMDENFKITSEGMN
jgi:hypothetical protein